jgi:Saxitoxin biosynthesis operon protein SxtJ
MERMKELETLAAVNIALLLSFFYSGRKGFVSASILVTLLCLLFPVLLFWLHRIWNSFFSFIGSVNAKILLAIVYFVLLVPIAFLFKITRKQKKPVTTGNYKTRDHLFAASDFERPG